MNPPPKKILFELNIKAKHILLYIILVLKVLDFKSVGDEGIK